MHLYMPATLYQVFVLLFSLCFSVKACFVVFYLIAPQGALGTSQKA